MNVPARYHGAPQCRCSSRNTQRIGQSALLRLCLDCGVTYAYRFQDGFMIPYGQTLLDESRKP